MPTYFNPPFENVVALTSFSVTTPEILYAFTALGDRFRTLLLAGFNDDPADDLLLYLDFSEDGITADSDSRFTLTIPALSSRIVRVDDLGPKYARITAESGKAGHASISGRYQFRSRRPETKIASP